MGFYRVGTAWDVQYDMQYWTSRSWSLTNCGSTQWTYIWDASHAGGWDEWRRQEYQLEKDQSWWCGSHRHHIRLFGSFVEESHDGFRWWSVGDAHYESAPDHCVQSWEGAEREVRDSFKDANGYPLWFVGAIWTTNLNNRGYYGCNAWNDGEGTFIELLY